MTDKSRKLPVSLLADEPTDQDAFHAHEKVANAIESIILEEEGGKSIALTGHWGSGKSSIVKMLNNKLKGQAKLFEFNAWTHEGDPLRRSFLESFINFLIEANWIDKAKGNNELEVITKRKEVTEVKNRTKPTDIGNLLLITTFLSPIGLIWFSKWPYLQTWQLIASILIGLGPVSVWLYAWLKYRLSNSEEENKEKFISILINRSDNTLKTETFRTIEPTSIEFQKKFFDLMDLALAKMGENKLVIVIDNLDRIESNDALRLWSTMRTFFDFNKVRNKEWYNRTWLLVPFDFSGLKKLWKNNDNQISNNQDNNKLLIHSFTDKTFQVVLETPLPVLADWAVYFNSQIRKSFNNYKNEEEIHKVYRIFRLKRETQSLPPTPREIKLFINALGSIYRQWDDLVPLHLQALYILLRKNVWQDDKNLIEDLLNNKTDFLEPISTDLLDKEYREYLAALFFNIDKQRALHLLLEQSLEKALISNDISYLKETENLNGFTEVCEDIINKNIVNWSNEEPKTLGLVSYSLTKLNIKEDDNLREAWRTLKRGFSRSIKWKSLNKNCSDGISAIIERFKETAFTTIIIKSITNSNSLFEENKSKEDQDIKIKNKTELNETLESLINIISRVISLGQTEIINDFFKINCSAKTYNSTMHTILNDGGKKKWAQYFYPISSPKDIISDLSGQVDSGYLYEMSWFVVIKQYSDFQLNWDWDSLISSIDSRLQQPSHPNSGEISFLIHALLFLSNTNTKLKGVIQDLSKKGYIFNHLFNLKTLNDDNASAHCLFCIIEFCPNGTVTAQFGKSPQGIQAYNEIKKSPKDFKKIILNYKNLIVEFDMIEKLYKIVNSEDSLTDLMHELIKILGDDENITSIMKTDLLIKEETLIYNSYDNEQSYFDLIKKYVDNTNLVEKLIGETFNSLLASIYIAVLKSNYPKVENFVNFLKNGLVSINKDEWKKEGALEHLNLLNLIITMVQMKIEIGLKTPFLDFLEEYVEEYFDKNTKIDLVHKNWSSFLNSMDNDHRKTFLGTIRHKLINSEKPLTPLFHLFDDNLFDCAVFIEDADDVVREGFNKIINRANLDEYNWLIKLLQKCDGIIDKCNKSYTSSFKERIRNKLETESLDSEVERKLVDIADILKIKWKRKNDSEN